MSDCELDSGWQSLEILNFRRIEGENEKFTELLWAWPHGPLVRKICLNFVNVFTCSSWKPWVLRDLQPAQPPCADWDCAWPQHYWNDSIGRWGCLALSRRGHRGENWILINTAVSQLRRRVQRSTVEILMNQLEAAAGSPLILLHDLTSSDNESRSSHTVFSSVNLQGERRRRASVSQPTKSAWL